METLHDILARHPGFAPAYGHYEDAPTTEEIWAANTCTIEEMRQLQEQYRLEQESIKYNRELQEIEMEGIRLIERTNATGMPERYRNTPLDIDHLEKLNKRGGLYIYGKRGNGKTWIACATTRAWLSRNSQGQPLFTTSVGLLSEISATFDTHESEIELIERYAGCPLLVIDDLGKENPTAYSLSRLWQLIDLRYGAMIPTIVTTQYAMDDLAKSLGRNGDFETAEAIVSRLREICTPVDGGPFDRRVGNQ